MGLPTSGLSVEAESFNCFADVDGTGKGNGTPIGSGNGDCVCVDPGVVGTGAVDPGVDAPGSTGESGNLLFGSPVFVVGSFGFGG